MDSMVDEDRTLPIDFDQTSNFLCYINDNRVNALGKDSRCNITVSDMSLPVFKENEKKKVSFTPADQPIMERPLSRGSMREQDNVISELKKECFGLKMRIYYMEEKLRDTYDSSTEEVLKVNIELKVTIEELKKELDEKSDLLAKASQAMQQISADKDKEIEEMKAESALVLSKLKANYEDQMDKKRKDMEKLVEEIDMLSKKLLASNEAALDTKKKSNADEGSYKEVISNQNKVIDDLKGLLETSKHKLEKYKKGKEKEETDLQEKIKELESALLLKENKIKLLLKDFQAEDETDQLNKQIKALQEELSSHDRTIRTLKSSLHEKDIDKQSTVKQLRNKLKIYEETLRASDKKLRQTEDEVTKLKEEISMVALKAEENEMNSAVTEKQNEIVEMQGQLTSKEKEISSLQCQFLKKDKEIQEVQSNFYKQEKEIKALKSALDEKEKYAMLFKAKDVNRENDLQKCIDEHQAHVRELTRDYESKAAEKQRRIDELQVLCQELEDRMNLNLTQKDHVISELTNAITSKDRFIESLVRTPTDESREENLLLTMKALKEELNQKEKAAQKALTEHNFIMKSKNNIIAELSKKNREKDSNIKQLEAKYALINKQCKHLERSDEAQQSLLTQLRLSLNESHCKEKELESSSLETSQRKDQVIERLTNLLATRDNELKNCGSHLSELVSKSENQKTREGAQETADIILKKFEQQMLDKDTLVKELSALKEDGNLANSTRMQ